MEALVTEYLRTGQLPRSFAKIGPTTLANYARDEFEVWLKFVMHRKDTKIASDRSVRTYKSNVNVWVRRYATGHQMRHVLHPAFLAKTQSGRATPGHLKRVTPQQQPGLKHFINMYETCCKQFHPGLPMYEEKAIKIKVAKKMTFEEVPTAVSSRRPQYAKEFVTQYMFRNEGLPTSVEELQKCVALYGVFEKQKQLAYAWGKSNVTPKVLLVNREDETS